MQTRTGAKYPAVGLDQIMPFGRHKGTPVWKAISQDPAWFEWAIKNTDLQLDNEAFAELQARLGRHGV